MTVLPAVGEKNHESILNLPKEIVIFFFFFFFIVLLLVGEGGGGGGRVGVRPTTNFFVIF